MRQAGILAAGGLYALEHNVERLAEDHDNAGHLSAGLRDLGFVVELPQTNIFHVEIAARHVAALSEHLLRHRIRASVAPRTRIVTHLDVPRESVDAVLKAFREYPGLAAAASSSSAA